MAFRGLIQVSASPRHALGSVQSHEPVTSVPACKASLPFLRMRSSTSCLRLHQPELRGLLPSCSGQRERCSIAFEWRSLYGSRRTRKYCSRCCGVSSGMLVSRSRPECRWIDFFINYLPLRVDSFAYTLAHAPSIALLRMAFTSYPAA